MEEVKFLSVSEWSQLHGKDPGNVRRLIQQGRIPAQKIGTQWAIPETALPPTDRRIKSGQYINWRKSSDIDTTQKKI